MTCETFLLNVAVGPVGRYIGQGRRSRDLWFRSRALSEMTRIAARSLEKFAELPGVDSVTAVDLILPTSDRINQSFLPQLDYENRGSGPFQHQGPTISNKIYAKVTASQEGVRALVDQTRATILTHLGNWLDAAQAWAIEGSKRGISPEELKQFPIPSALNKKTFQAQRDAIAEGDFLEFFAVWVPIVDQSDRDAFQRLREAMNSRKSLREFQAPTWSKPGKPRSSSNPNWASVFDEPEDPGALQRAVIARGKLGIRRQERLDALSLLSRFAEFSSVKGNKKTPNQDDIKLPALPFPPIHRVAADPWLAGVPESELKKVHQTLEDFSNRDATCLVATRVRILKNDAADQGGQDENAEKTNRFPWDPSLFFDDNLLAKQREYSRPTLPAFNFRPFRLEGAEAWSQAKVLVKRLQPRVNKIQREYGCPTPYYAMLEADGDSIGSIIDGLTTEQRIKLAKALYTFSDKAYGIIEEHGGYAFYSAGDEVKAYLPIDKVLPAYKKLLEAFEEKVKTVPDLKNELASSGLSGAIVIAHAKEDLRRVRSRVSELLSETKNLKKQAKEDEAKKSWLAVEEQPAGGPCRSACGPQEALLGDFTALIRFAKDSELSKSTAHTLLSLYQRFKETPVPKKKEDPSVALGLASVLQKARRSGTAIPEKLEEIIRELHQPKTTWDDLRDLAYKIIIAERFARAEKERAGKGNTKEEGQ